VTALLSGKDIPVSTEKRLDGPQRWSRYLGKRQMSCYCPNRTTNTRSFSPYLTLLIDCANLARLRPDNIHFCYTVKTEIKECVCGVEAGDNVVLLI
jgi:hypothetical protein